MLEIYNLHVSTKGSPILEGLNLMIRSGEVHVIMGPNGAGKSTLVKVLAGHPAYEVTQGQMLFEGRDISTMSPEERAYLGLFLSFQDPPEIAGVKVEKFMYEILSARQKAQACSPPRHEEVRRQMKEQMDDLQMSSVFLEREVNVGFSGGEKKRSEMMQMAVLNPKLALLDEADSGLDMDGMRLVGRLIQSRRQTDRSFLIITHHRRLLEHIAFDYVHVLMKGRIVRSGKEDLVNDLERKGYEWI